MLRPSIDISQFIVYTTRTFVAFITYVRIIIMKTITATELRSNIYNLLDEVLETGIPLEISRGGKNCRSCLPKKVDKLGIW